MNGTWRFVALVTAWQVAASVCYYTVFAATPFLRDAFDLSGLFVGLVVTTLTLGYTLSLLPVGVAIDRYGERRVLLLGLVGLAIGAVAVTAAWSYGSLLVAAFALGAAYSSAIPGTNRAIFDGVAGSRQNLALGIKQVGVTAGSGISALLIPGVAAALGEWRVGFLTVGVAALAANAVFYVGYRGGSGGGATDPPDLRSVFAIRPYRWLTAAGFFLGACLFTTVGYTILYLTDDVGTGVAFAGAVLATVQVTGSGGRIVGGWLADRLPGPPSVAITRLLLAQAAFGTASFLGVTLVADPVGSVVVFAALGFFVLGFTGIYYSCMRTFVPDERTGSATAGGQIALNSGALVAPPAFGFLVDIAGYDAAWSLLAACGGVAVALLAGIERRARRDG